MQTGLHRNTISKVYERLEIAGFVEAQMGSGIYVRALGHDSAPPSPKQVNVPVEELIEQSLDGFLQQGYSLSEVKRLMLAAIKERLRASSQLIVTVPQHDLGAGEIIVQELHEALSTPIQLVPLEELEATLKKRAAATIVTVRYFAKEAHDIVEAHQDEDPKGFRIIPIDIYNYSDELELIKSLPKEGRLGLVSLSSGTLGVAEVMISSLRGDDLYVMTAQCHDASRLKALIRHSQTIISDRASSEPLKAAIREAEPDLIRWPKVIYCKTYIDTQSVESLKRELGIDSTPATK
jgi:GntR family transcriptional regulator